MAKATKMTRKSNCKPFQMAGANPVTSAMVGGISNKTSNPNEKKPGKYGSIGGSSSK